MLDSLVRVSRRVEWDPTFYSLLWAPTVSRRDRSRPEGPTGDAAQVEGRETQDELTHAPYVDPPAGRRVLLGWLL